MLEFTSRMSSSFLNGCNAGCILEPPRSSPREKGCLWRSSPI